MEQNHTAARTRGLTGVLVRYVLLCGGGVALILAVWWVGFALLLNSGLVLPANTAERAAADAAAEMERTGVFSADAVPPLCHYLWADADGAVLGTDLTGKALAAARRYLADGYNSGGWYHTAARLPGRTCVLQYRLQSEYAAPALRGRLPDITWLSFGVLIALIAAWLFLLSARTTRLLRRGWAPVAAAARQLAGGDLAAPLPASSIREYNEALRSMAFLQSSLRESLQAQWALEHSRADQMNALAHDLRTPLTVIDGNAQLLAETELSADQRQSLDAILRGSTAAQEYVSTMRELARASAAAQPPAETPAPQGGAAFAALLQADLTALCRPAGLEPVWQGGALPTLTLCPQAVRRAAGNLFQNAVEHTPAGGRITCRCTAENACLVLRITDGGPGFTPAALRRGAEPLFTENAARTPGGHLGLGLAFVQEVARRHGGSLTLSNEQGHGCAVLTLPCLPGE